MQKTVVLMETSGMSAYEYDAVLIELENSGRLYDLRRSAHVAFDRNGTWYVVDVWESPEAFRDYEQSVLRPIFDKLGLRPPEYTLIPAHQYLGTHAEEPIAT